MKISTSLTTFVAAALLLAGAFNLYAQENPPGSDGSKDASKSRLKAILEARRQRSPERIEKVSEVRRAASSSGFGSLDRTTDADVDALRKAVEANAGAEDLKARMAKVRESRKQKEAALEKAQEDLRQILTARQEAVALMMGLLK